MPHAAQRPRKRRSLLLPYLALGVLTIATLAGSLMLGSYLRRLHVRTIHEAMEVTARGQMITSLRERVAAVNAPGNDVFETGNVSRESTRLDSTVAAFAAQLAVTRTEFARQLDGPDERQFARHLNQLEGEVDAMAAEARGVLAAHAAGRVLAATRRMAVMDRMMKTASGTIGMLRAEENRFLNRDLEQYLDTAERLRALQALATFAGVVLVLGIGAYARRLVRSASAVAAEQREQLAALHSREAELEALSAQLEHRVDERTVELQGANDELRRTQERFELVARATQDVIWDADLTTGRTWYSEALTTLFGYPATPSVPRDWWMERVHPDDRQAAEGIFLKAIEASDVEHRNEYRFRRSDGSYAHVLDRGFIIRDAAGRATRAVGSTMDVSTRRKAERQVVSQHAFLRQVIDTIPHFVFAKDREGRFTLANQAVAAAYGVTSEEMIGKRDADFTGQDEELANFRSDDQQVMETGRQLLVPEERITNAAGEERWLQTVKRPIVNEDGAVDQILGVSTDITALREASERNAQLAAIVQAADLTIYSFDLQGTLVSWNPGAERMYGHAAAEVVGRPLRSIIPDEAREDVRRLREELERGARVARAETVARRRDGTLLDIAVSVSSIHDRKGAVIGHAAFSRDITELKEATRRLLEREAQLAEAQRMAHLGSWTWEARTSAVTWSDEMFRLLGYEPAAIVPTLEAFMSLVHPQDLAFVQRQLDTVIETGTPVEFTFRQWRPSGDLRVFTAHAVAVLDDEGRLDRVTGTALDVTQARCAEAAERLAREEAEAASTAKSEFLATMSHEIRTPMNGVLGMLELVLGTDLTPAQRDFVATARGSGEALLEIINDILDFSKIESGHLKLDPRPFSIRGMLQSTLPPFAVRAREKQLELTTDIAADLPQVLVGDAGRLRQIIVNLLGNAIKFTAAGRVELRAFVEAADPDGIELHVSVRDTGVGIAPEQHHSVFEAFQQADSSTSRTFGGTGLGLSIAAQLVDLMGGRIWLESEPGKGSTFHFTARLGVGTGGTEAGVDHAPRPRGTNGTAPAPPLPRLRVLLAEDNVVNRKLASAFLERAGHEVVAVVDGQLAVDTVQRQHFDVALMDVQMPRMGGIDATRLIRVREAVDGRPRLPIIAVTAGAMKGDRDRCLAAGMDGYVSKPMTSDALFSEIARVTGHGRGVPLGRRASPSGGVAAGDREQLLRAVGGDRTLLEELVGMFLADYPEQLKRMQDAISAGDAATLKFAAHSVKGSAGSLTGSPAAALAAAVERSAGDGDLAGAAESLGRLEQELVRLHAWLLALHLEQER